MDNKLIIIIGINCCSQRYRTQANLWWGMWLNREILLIREMLVDP